MNPPSLLSKCKRLSSVARAMALCAAGVAILLAMPATARAQIFVTNVGGPGNNYVGSIGKYNFDGTPVNASLVSGLTDSWGLAAQGSDLYLVDGTNINAYTTAGNPVGGPFSAPVYGGYGIAVSGSYVFATNQEVGYQSISEYTTSGALVNGSLITGLTNGPLGIAVSGSDIFVTNRGNGYGAGTIGEYTTTGGTVNGSLITGLYEPIGIAISGSYIFVANNVTGSIGEYGLDGTPVNTSLITGLNDAQFIAVSGSDIFVVNSNDTVGEYTTTGGTVNASLITGLDNPVGIAVIPAPVPEPSVWTMLGVGAAGVLLCARRRRGNAKKAPGDLSTYFADMHRF